MPYEKLSEKLSQFDDVISSLGIRLDSSSPVTLQLNLTRQFLADYYSKPESEWPKPMQQDFNKIYQAQIVTMRLASAIVALRTQPPVALRHRLTSILSGTLTQDYCPDQAKDYFYELELASVFAESGFTITLREPDIVVSGKGMDREIGVACKYPSSEQQLQEHLSKGYRQIARAKLSGVVAFGIEQLVLKGCGPILDFNQGSQPPLVLVECLLDDAIKRLVIKRTKGYPSELPVDGCLLTFFVAGFYGKPAHLHMLKAMQFQSDGDNPSFKTLKALFNELEPQDEVL